MALLEQDFPIATPSVANGLPLSSRQHTGEVTYRGPLVEGMAVLVAWSSHPDKAVKDAVGVALGCDLIKDHAKVRRQSV